MKKKSIIVAIILAVITALYFVIQHSMTQNMQKGLDEAIADISEFADVSYGSAGINLLRASAYLNDVRIVIPALSEKQFEIKKIVIYNIDRTAKPPHFAKVSINGLKIPLPESIPLVFFEIPFVGGETLVDINVDYELRPAVQSDFHGGLRSNMQEILVSAAKKTSPTTDGQPDLYDLILKKLDVGIDTLFSLHCFLEVQNIDISGNKNVFYSAAIKRAGIEYRDASLIPSVIKRLAEMDAVSAEDVTQTAVNFFEEKGMQASEGLIKDACFALKNFIANPKKITVSVEPKTPITYAQLNRMNGDKIMNILNLKITVPNNK